MSPSREAGKKTPAQVVAVEMALPMRGAEGWSAVINGPNPMTLTLAAPRAGLSSQV